MAMLASQLPLWMAEIATLRNQHKSLTAGVIYSTCFHSREAQVPAFCVLRLTSSVACIQPLTAGSQAFAAPGARVLTCIPFCYKCVIPKVLPDSTTSPEPRQK